MSVTKSMGYKSLYEAVLDLERQGQLVRITEEVDPYLEAAAIHLRVFEQNGPALYFENLKNCKFPAVSNLFGTLERSRYLFRDSLSVVKKIVGLRANPAAALKNPFSYLDVVKAAPFALPKKVLRGPVFYDEISVSDIPPIVNWPMDGGAFVTLPVVYSEDIQAPGIMKANMGMYRIQYTGNAYEINKEVGLHYQLHRGIGVHQTKAFEAGKPLKVSVFVGGPPGHSVAAVMPLPEGFPEAVFAGVLSSRRFRYAYHEGFAVSTDADFVITGEVHPNDLKPEGPFGDHLGYYSLTHPFPVMKVHKVWARKNAIWPFTVVGRPPQEDTSFGALIHEIAGGGISAEIPGLKEVHAVDAAGVHPLLLATAAERYTPYLQVDRPAEVLTIANHVLGSGQLSLAKYLFIAATDQHTRPDVHHIPQFFSHVLERFLPERDVHFYTKTTIDTLDYSGEGLNMGSKVVFACAFNKVRELSGQFEHAALLPQGFRNPKVAMKGVLMIESPPFNGYQTDADIRLLTETLAAHIEQVEGFPLIVLCDNSDFAAASLNNFLWVTFTRSNPSHDIHGVHAFMENKHWGCRGPVIIDARIKPHHAPACEKVPEIEKKVDRLGEKGKSLHGII